MLKCSRCGKEVPIRYGPGTEWRIQERINTEDGRFCKPISLCVSCMDQFNFWMYEGGYAMNRPNIPMLPVVNRNEQVLDLSKQLVNAREQILKLNDQLMDVQKLVKNLMILTDSQ